MNVDDVQMLLNHPIKDLDDMPEMFKYFQKRIFYDINNTNRRSDITKDY
jgi:hypothetical protein